MNFFVTASWLPASAGRPFRRAVLAGIALVLLIGSVAAAAPVATSDASTGITTDTARLSETGSTLLEVNGGVIVVSEADLGQQALSVLDVNALTVGAQQVVAGPASAQGNRIAVIDIGGDRAVASGITTDPATPVLRLLEQPTAGGSSFVEVGTAVLPEDAAANLRRFGASIALGGNAIAVVSETSQQADRIDIFTIGFDGTVRWAQQLGSGTAAASRGSGTLQTRVALSNSGAVIATSGVNRLAGSGELAIYRIGTNGWIPTQRFLRIGGGAVVVEGDRVFVERNSFFARNAGPWTVLTSLPGTPFRVIAELPVEGSALAADGDIVAVGDPQRDLVYLLEANSDDTFRFSQAVRVPGGDPGSASPRFGSAVALTDSWLVVGAPGNTRADQGGAVYRFLVQDGPIGCTVVGTAGNDELRSAGGSEGSTICGLNGADRLFGVNATDRLDGGPGQDTCSGTAATVTNCE